MIRTLCVATLLAACAPAGLRAQDDAPSCDDARTQTEMNLCAGIAFQAADSVLNQVYPRVVAGVDSARVPLLREAQRQWIRLRDADCALEAAAFQGGSMQPMVYGLCRAERTRERVAHLRSLLVAETDQADERGAVTQAAEALFAAMRTRDTAALRTLMHPRAQIVAVRDGRVSVRSADEWIGGLSLTAGELIERMWDPRVQLDGDLATLWAPYDIHVGERFSHCGMDAFQFVRVDGAWKMITVTFTGRTAGCDGAP